MHPRSRKIIMFSTAVSLALTTACAGKQGAVPAPQQTPSQMEQIKMQQAPSSDYRALDAQDKELPIVTIAGVKYVSARDLVDTLQYQSDWDAATKTLAIGDNDASYELVVDSTKARKEDAEVVLANAPVLQGDTAYLPVSAVADLFKEDMSYDISDDRMIVHATNDPVAERIDEDGVAPAELDFADDPNDPFKGGDENAAEAPAAVTDVPEELPVTTPVSWQDEDAVPVIKNVDINALVRKGRQYMGVQYKFGTGSYAKTGYFDCSTFTGYVFGKFGINLPRTARAQARQGVWVSRKSLRKGDLMFFAVPGRFKSNKIVGHVGIYIGNGQMLHASPAPKNGVQISNINKAYWKKTFLTAKRVAF
ncbi:C40 family peptidase [Paenibacillus hamazuiensis]|uniref:C40 family peptidase n=1 Tax=Paenibacillus hamazuiensis TaxID=2936508 RepID=UPI00200C0F04|nr:NlpC/P60 family protein [Paenibacillus hamazuiensis]